MTTRQDRPDARHDRHRAAQWLALVVLLGCVACGTTPAKAPVVAGPNNLFVKDTASAKLDAQPGGEEVEGAQDVATEDAGDGEAPSEDVQVAQDDGHDAAIDVPAVATSCQTDLDCKGKAVVKACQVPHCDTATGQCGVSTAPKYWPCEDGDPCTFMELCIGGKCDSDTGMLSDCNDGNACTQDACASAEPGANPKTGCLHLATDGVCSDGNACTLADACKSGICKGNTAAGCGCQTDDDCLPFEDGDLCNGKLACKAGLCAVNQATIVKCPAQPGTCIVETCDPKLGQCVKHEAEDDTACDDGLPCTKSTACQGGVCKGGFGICTCSTDFDCAPFDDGDPCDGVLACESGKCKVKAGSVVVCPGKGGCIDNLCNPKTAKCEQLAKADGASCEDGNICTVGESCSEQICSGGNLNACDDQNPCTTDFCAGSCSHLAKSNIACEDGNLCTGGEICQLGKCQGGKEVDCDDKSPCTTDTCDAKAGCLHQKLLIGCDDLNACTSGEACSNGSCTGGKPTDCDDKNPCTLDSCDVGKGCVQAQSAGFCDTGDACTSPGTCKTGACIPAKNKCVDCLVDKDCLAQDDGNLCNGTPVCKAGECVDDANTAIVCDKSADTACILTFCNALTGACQKAAAPAGVKCEDGNACTAGDVCAAGLCKAGTIAPASGTCPGDVCGDGFCKKDKETCQNCAQDCGNCFSNCGDGKCEYQDELNTQLETCSTCQADCGKCNAGCKPAGSLFCSSDVLWSTASGGATDGVDSLAGACSGNATGNEFTYAFTGMCDGPINIVLMPQDPKQALSLYVMDGTKACAGASCLKAVPAATGPQTLTIDVKKGVLYFIAVDSANAPGDYEIKVDCQCGPPVVCGDGKCDPKKEDCSVCAKDCGACQTCGDSVCLKGTEDCTNCAKDCGACNACGDGKCVAPAEDCYTCPADCKIGCTPCGDGKCDILGGAEDCAKCQADCGACATTCQPLPLSTTCGTSLKGQMGGAGSTKAIANWSCLGGNHAGPETTYNFNATCTGVGYIKVVRDTGTLGNIDILIVDPAKTCDGSTCVAFGQMLAGGTAVATFQAEKGKAYQVVLDSTSGATASYTVSMQCFNCAEGCGNTVCDGSETCSACPVDCGLCSGCGDKVCNGTESCTTCPGDCGQCPFCGDGKCDASSGESCKTCLKDCGKCPITACGDGKCDAPTETCTSCAKDCGACVGAGNGCSGGTTPGCSGCPCEACVCAIDSYCCQNPGGKWTAYCANLCKVNCGGNCP